MIMGPKMRSSIPNLLVISKSKCTPASDNRVMLIRMITHSSIAHYSYKLTRGMLDLADTIKE